MVPYESACYLDTTSLSQLIISYMLPTEELDEGSTSLYYKNLVLLVRVHSVVELEIIANVTCSVSLSGTALLFQQPTFMEPSGSGMMQIITRMQVITHGGYCYKKMLKWTMKLQVLESPSKKFLRRKLLII